MDFPARLLRRISSNKTSRASQSRAVKLKLDDLPAKILRKIARLLPLEYATLLCLCNHTLRRSIGAECSERLRLDATCRQRIKFLLLRDKGHDAIIFCYYCQRFHDPLGTADPDRWELAGEIYPCAMHDLANGWFHSQFNFSVVQWAMKLHRMGVKTRAALATLESYKESYTSENTNPVVKWDLKASIENGDLYIRAQTCIEGKEDQKLAGIEMPAGDSFRGPCGHYMSMHSLMVGMECATSRPESVDPNLNCSTCAGIKYCSTCWTKFEITALKDGVRFKIRIRATFRLGSGIDPNGPDWRSTFEPLDRELVEPYAHRFEALGWKDPSISASGVSGFGRRLERTTRMVRGFKNLFRLEAKGC